jgi:tripartite-type tricarboxylate transporter receptor subunit TctC
MIAALVLFCGHAGTGFAQSDYPTRPITMIVPFAAGGPTDVIARLLEGSLSRSLSQQIVIENVVGAGGTTAATRAMRAAPDGYTIMLGNMGTHAAAVALYPKLAYFPSTDFAPIGLVVRTSILMVARKDFPARDLTAFIAYANEHAGELKMAHAGIGSVSYVACALFNAIIGVSPKLAGFQGTEPAMSALLAGKADYMCDQTVAIVPRAKALSIHVYAVASPTRNRSLPDIPTAQEAGLPQFEVTAWNALFALKGTPRPIIDKLNAALGTALADPAVRKALLDVGSEIPDHPDRSPEALARLVRHEIARWMHIPRFGEAKN